MDAIEEAVARALRAVDWGADDFPSTWSEEYWTLMARVAITAHLEALDKAGVKILRPLGRFVTEYTAPTAIDAAEFVVVPIEPTEAILSAAGFGEPGSEPYLDAESDYRAMIDAAKKKGILSRPASSLSVDELHSRTPATFTQEPAHSPYTISQHPDLMREYLAQGMVNAAPDLTQKDPPD